MFFTQTYIYDNNNKNINMLIYKKSLKKFLCLFHKTFSNCQASYQKKLYLLFEKSGNFSQSEHRDRFDSSPPLFVFIRSLRTPPPQQTLGFPQVLRTWWGGGALQNMMGAGLKSIHGGSMMGLKIMLKNTSGGVHLIVKLLAISLQACKFTKNELLHSNF